MVNLHKFLYFFFNKLIKKNTYLKNKYKNKKCFIFGNGASIKNIDLKLFKQLPSMVTTMMYLHKDFKHLNVIADFEIAPFILYKFWKNPYSKKYEINQKNSLLRNTNRFNFNHPIFVSLSNYFSNIEKKNIHYIYHFGKKNFSLDPDPSNCFPYLQGSMYSMIAMAEYMGFSDIYLVGFDYLLKTPTIGHFYEKELIQKENLKPFKTEELNLFNLFKQRLNIKIISTFDQSSEIFDFISYEKLFKVKEDKKSNYDIVEKKYLNYLNNIKMNYQIF